MKEKLEKWLDSKWIDWKINVTDNNKGMGTVEVILIIVVIFTIYMGCK